MAVSNGSLTTSSNPNIFTPPSSCSRTSFRAWPYGYDVIYTQTQYPVGHQDSLRTYIVMVADYFDNMATTSCYPKGYGFVTFTSNGTPTATQSVLSPATCPHGYTDFNIRITSSSTDTSSVTVATCCPSGQIPAGNVGSVPSTAVPSRNYGSPPIAYNACQATAANVVYVSDSAESSATYTATAEGYGPLLFTPQVTVQWQESDLALFEPDATTTIAPESSTSTPSVAVSASTALPTSGAGASHRMKLDKSTSTVIAFAALLVVATLL